jgi:hypothetical protein
MEKGRIKNYELRMAAKIRVALAREVLEGK